MTPRTPDDFDLTPEQEAALWDSGETVELVAPWELWSLTVGDHDRTDHSTAGWLVDTHGSTTDREDSEESMVALPAAS